MEDLLDKLENLNLNTLREEWIHEIFYSEFLEFGDLPPEFENVVENLNIDSIFLEILQSIDNWLQEEPSSSEEKTWAKLTHKIKHEPLLAILSYYINNGNKNVVDKEHRNHALLASRLYIKLLSIPGYKAYHIYHSQLFTHSLVCLSYLKIMYCNEDNVLTTRELVEEVTRTLNSLKVFAADLRDVVATLQLKASDMNYADILSNLLEWIGSTIVRKLNLSSVPLHVITIYTNEMVSTLICDSNGTPDPSALQIFFKCLLHKLLAASVDNKSINNIIRFLYASYTSVLLNKYGKAALSSYNTLLQHLCYTLDGLERAEVRTARINLVFALITLLPKKSYEDLIKWFIKLSTTSKVPHRQIATEILGRILTNDPKEMRLNEDASQEDVAETISENVENAVDLNEIQQEGNAENNNATVEETDQNQSMDENDANEDAEKNESPRSVITLQGEIIRAMYERVHDVSSTLRMRAITILTECVSSTDGPTQDAIKELNGRGDVPRLLNVAAKCACDERAIVRRAASILVQKLLASATQLSSDDLAIIVNLCRDASILVRSSAITGLGELLIQSPSDTTVDAFLTGPMNQLSDPEAKVQELVVNVIQQILIDKLGKYTSSKDEDLLPWHFLAGIIRHNMRSHLQKACTLLINSSRGITSRIVETVGSHLSEVDEARDLQCLVFLSGLARHFPDCNPDYLLRYFYRLDDRDHDVEACDVRILGLIYELLTIWSKAMTQSDRDLLKANLVQKLAVSTSSGNDRYRPACVTLAAHLDPENLQWASELMLQAEKRALSGGPVEEWVRAADLSLVAPLPPSDLLLQQILAALTNPPPYLSSTQLGAVAAGAGRLCLRSREAAAHVAPALAALLRDPGAPLPARLNALLALTDVCVRYTCIVEPLLDSVCQCVNVNTLAPLRRAAARALTRLLLAGYLRLRTPLYYRYCALLADEDHDVREPAEYYVSSCLTSESIYHHFVDCVLHYNAEDAEALSFDARQLIYDVMLQRLSLVQKLNVQCRLAREVLGHAADLTDEGDGDLPAALQAALLDTITVLCGPRMKLPKKPQTGETADIDELQERVTTNIVSHKMKRTVAEVLVPAVLRLYGKMRTRGGQLAAYLVRIATDLLNDYRQEIEELIDNDEELVKRVHHFQQTIGLEPSFGNARNLVTTSAPADPDTPHSTRKRTSRVNRDTPRKRPLRD